MIENHNSLTCRVTKVNGSNSIPSKPEEVEIWKGIDLFEGLYEVSNLGRVRSTSYLIEVNGGSYWTKGKVLKQYAANCREMTICISCAQLGFKRSPYLVNRLVAKAFIPNPNNLPQAIHIDCDNFNNRADNLMWGTHTECVRKDISQKRRSNTLTEVKKGAIPSDNFFEKQLTGRTKSQMTRRRSVEVIYPNGQMRSFDTVKDAEIELGLSTGHIHLSIRRGKNGIGKAKRYIFKFP